MPDQRLLPSLRRSGNTDTPASSKACTTVMDSGFAELDEMVRLS
jgi:hypothetical protein